MQNLQFKGADDKREVIRDALAYTRKYLPSQGPLHSFVHHNILHAFEQLPFEKAVVKAAQMYGTEPFLSEMEYAKYLQQGRISQADIDAIIDEETFEGGEGFNANFTLKQFYKMRLQHCIKIPSEKGIRWAIDEHSMLTEFYDDVDESARAKFLANCSMDRRAALAEVWRLCSLMTPSKNISEQKVRPQRQIFAATGINIDELVHPLMIRLCGAFVDQGIAYWSMPHKERGFLHAVRYLYGQGFGPPDPWLKGLACEFARQESAQMNSEDTIAWALDQLTIPKDKMASYISEALLSLRGWAGFINQFELKPERAPLQALNARLSDYLAVFLVLDVWAITYTKFDMALEKIPHDGPKTPDLKLAYEAFVMAQIAGLGPAQFPQVSVVQKWIDLVATFDEVNRRRILHLAYERKHRNESVAAILTHSKAGRTPTGKGKFQAVFCIDAREESLRRYLEELVPEAQTFGYAGFFGVAMFYQGLEDVMVRPHCPGPVTPLRLVKEYSIDSSSHTKFIGKRRLHGKFAHLVHAANKSMAMGWLTSTVLGPLASLSLIGRCIAPGLMQKVVKKGSEKFVQKPITRLLIDQAQSPDGKESNIGFSIPEMAVIVKTMFLSINLMDNFAPIVVAVGHGSSSLNNPHESAYDCAATRGSKGGPNARAYAAMANKPEVRDLLKKEGIIIPDTTWFLGAHHNTCDDSMEYFDEDLVPKALHDDLKFVKQTFKQACLQDAQERVRRFESVPTTTSEKKAIAFAQERACDLGQPRPEAGNATNALCVIGRRDLTKDLFLDRRCFLISYDQVLDETGAILESLMQAVIPVCQGISLEYYFSYLDPVGYGSGTKLPHNIVGLMAVMDGHSSDIRTGLPWQMVELHEPIRLVTFIESKPQMILDILAKNPLLLTIVGNFWIHLFAIDPKTKDCFVFKDKQFIKHEPQPIELSKVGRSLDHFFGKRDHLSMVRLGGAHD